MKNFKMRGKFKMEKLKLEIMNSIAERKEELKEASTNFIEQDKNNEGLVWSSHLIFMKEMIQDIENLHKMLNKLKGADDLEELDEDEIEELINDEIEMLRIEGSAEYRKFINERSFED